MLQVERPDLVGAPRFMMGHSVGEYAALVAAGSLSLWDAARLLRLRGEAMQAAADAAAASEPDSLGMQAWILAAPKSAEQGDRVATVSAALASAAAARASAAAVVAAVAAVNTPTQVTVSGHVAALNDAAGTLKGPVLRRAVPLPVSAPFHSPIMATAATAVGAALGLDAAAAAGSDGAPSWRAALRDASVPLVCNADTSATTAAPELASRLVAGITRPVLWRQGVEAAAAAGARSFLELGPGTTLCSFVKQIAAPPPAAAAAASAGGEGSGSGGATAPQPPTPVALAAANVGTSADVALLARG